MAISEREQALRLHDDLAFIGLRAQATVVGLVQLCTELMRVGVLDDAAVGRIKTAIRQDISVSRTRMRSRETFETHLMQRLDAIFPTSDKCRPAETVGSEAAFQHALETSAEEVRPTD